MIWKSNIPILFSALALSSMGLIMIYSASSAISQNFSYHSLYFLMRQSIHMILALAVGFLMLGIAMSTWQRITLHCFLIGYIGLILVLIPPIGHCVNGSMRWINMGVMNFQISEFSKFAAILYMAKILSQKRSWLSTSWVSAMKPMVMLVPMVGLLLLEPDFGAALVLITTAIAMIFLAGIRIRYLMILFWMVGIILGCLAIASPYRILRLLSFIDPWAEPFGSGYQLSQALIAFGRADFWGVGLGRSLQKMFYLPEVHTDFLFCVLAEELGFLGILGILAVFLFWIYRSMIVGHWAEQSGLLFHAYVTYGISFSLGFQAMINMGVNVGLFPTKGLTLPLMSYGGSSLLMQWWMIAIVLRVAYETGSAARRL